MSTFIIGSITGALLGWLMGSLSLFLILLVLVQRGKGGGLTGALGGPGGQSAFGSKAGDTFTLITVVVASVWGFTCAFTMWLLGTQNPTPFTMDSAVKSGPGDQEFDGLQVPALTPESDLSDALDDNAQLIPSDAFMVQQPDSDGSDSETSESMQLTPAASEPASSEPAESEPAESEPAESEPASSEPADSNPAAESVDESPEATESQDGNS